MFGRAQKSNTTPKEISAKILELCAKIDSTQKPLFVEVANEQGNKQDDCFENVRLWVEKKGGRIQYGWTIWENPQILVEGEFHAVWETPEGRLLDITPKRDGEAKILFLPDSKKIWTEEPVDNIRLPLTDATHTRLMIRLNESMFALHKRYYKNGKTEVPYDEYLATLARFGLNPDHPKAIGVYDFCPCGSGNKFKFCCAEAVKNSRK
jgi:hypothetical protein